MFDFKIFKASKYITLRLSGLEPLKGELNSCTENMKIINSFLKLIYVKRKKVQNYQQDHQGLVHQTE